MEDSQGHTIDAAADGNNDRKENIKSQNGDFTHPMGAESIPTEEENSMDASRERQEDFLPQTRRSKG